MNGKIILKRMLSSLCTTAGFFSLAERLRFSQKAFVLMYHRILDDPLKQPLFIQDGMYVKTLTFDKHLAFLKNRFKLVFLDELIDKINNGGNIGGQCAITFDDGWRDNFSEAFPLLEKRGVPATVFLTSSYVGTEKVFWPEEISFYLENLDHGLIDHEHLSPTMVLFFRENSLWKPKYRKRQLDHCIEFLKVLSPEDRVEVIEFFRRHSCIARIPRQMMDWNEARKMLSSGLVRFGAHTASHAILDQVTPQEARQEIETSKDEIERQLGSRVRTFAYPNGNYTEDICKILKECGFSGAVTTRKGLLVSTTHPMKIPRIAIHEDVSSTVDMLRSRILWRRY